MTEDWEEFRYGYADAVANGLYAKITVRWRRGKWAGGTHTYVKRAYEMRCDREPRMAICDVVSAEWVPLSEAVMHRVDPRSLVTSDGESAHPREGDER